MSGIKAIVSSLIIFVIAGLIALALGQNSFLIGTVPASLFIVLAVFAIQWLAFIPAFIFQTERFFDAMGSATYIAVAIFSLSLLEAPSSVQWIVAALVVVWALRLGSYLLLRIVRDGKDGRFDELKPNFFLFLNVWNIQALWVTLTAAAALAVLTSPGSAKFTLWTAIGLALWLAGFVIEAVADRQKSSFRRQSANKDRFIDTGLWSLSRHPNYFGEIVIWLGMAVIAFPALQGWQHVSLISPIFVTFLLTKVSGVPLLEKRADKKWGKREDYQQYKANTPVLIPGILFNRQ
jgi:steroid 5-alpha reductase family enzyme